MKKNLLKWLFLPDFTPLYQKIFCYSLSHIYALTLGVKKQNCFDIFPFFNFFLSKNLLAFLQPQVFYFPLFFRHIFSQIIGDCFRIRLSIIGVGYYFKAINNKILEIALGYCHPIYFFFPFGVTYRVLGRKKRMLLLQSVSHHLLLSIADKIHNLRSLDLYKNKGIRFTKEKLRKKRGKKKFV